MANTEGCVHYIIAKEYQGLYRKENLHARRWFSYPPDEKEIEHLNELKTEISVDNYALSIIMSR